MQMNERYRTVALAAALVLPAAAASANDEERTPAWQVSGDFRTMYNPAWRDTRSGGESESDPIGARFRLRLKRELNEHWTFQTRFATTWEDEGNDPEFYLRSERESGTEVEPGTATLDELFVEYRGDAGTRLRIGRQQSTMTLPLLTSKSLDRNQASNINIGWTDGISVRQPIAGGWYGEAFVQYHSREGNGFVTRGPLAFDDEDSRIGYFGALANEQEFGPIFLRALTVTMFPDTLADNGVAAAERSDYVNATAKLAAGWDLDEQGRRLIVAGEVGHAFDTPERTVLGLPGSGDAGGWAWQLGADIEEFLPKQTIGIVYGQVDGGWLISNDYRQNNELAELRWQYQFTKEFRIQFRARWRRDLERRAGAAFLQRDRDMRIRATWKF